MIRFSFTYDTTGIQEILELFTSFEEATDVISNQVAERIYSRIRESADSLLTTSRQHYLDSLGVEGNVVSLGNSESDQSNSVADIVENGTAGFDMKSVLLRSGETYRHIPFIQATPDSRGNRAVPMGHQYLFTGSGVTADYAKTIGRKIYKQALKLDRGGKGLKGTNAPKIKSHHVSNPFEGMRRVSSGGAGRDQSSYLTFRTVSANSEGWEYPATDGEHFFEQAREGAGEYANEIISAMVQEARARRKNKR